MNSIPQRGIDLLASLVTLAGDGEHVITATVVGRNLCTLTTEADFRTNDAMTTYSMNAATRVIVLLDHAASGRHPSAAMVLATRIGNTERRRVWNFENGEAQPLTATDAHQAATTDPHTGHTVPVPVGVFFEDAPPISPVS